MNQKFDQLPILKRNSKTITTFKSFNRKLMLLDSGAGMGSWMVSTSLTYEDIAQQLASDERFAPEAKCKLARRMFEPELSNGLCSDN